MRRMAYMLLIHEPAGQRATRTRAEGEAVYERMVRFGRRPARARPAAGRGVAGVAGRRAARVQVRGGRAQVLDGPFAEAKEMIGGFFLLNCKTRDEALAIARECPAAEWATVEVRETAPCLRSSRVFPWAGCRFRAASFVVRIEAADARRFHPRKESPMRFMIIVKATPDSEAGRFPDNPEPLFAAMADLPRGAGQGRRAARCLRPATEQQGLARAVRRRQAHRRRRPFTESKELIAGYTLIQMRSRDEALEWTRRFPNPIGEGAPATSRCASCTSWKTSTACSSRDAERFRDIGME